MGINHTLMNPGWAKPFATKISLMHLSTSKSLENAEKVYISAQRPDCRPLIRDSPQFWGPSVHERDPRCGVWHFRFINQSLWVFQFAFKFLRCGVSFQLSWWARSHDMAKTFAALGWHSSIDWRAVQNFQGYTFLSLGSFSHPASKWLAKAVVLQPKVLRFQSYVQFC